MGGDPLDVACTEEEEFEIMREMGMKPEQVANEAEAERYRAWRESHPDKTSGSAVKKQKQNN